MSAIVAAVGATLSPGTKAWVIQATVESRRAGPDGDAVTFQGRCGLGHCLLRTASWDRVQPATVDGACWITADARLDDRQGLIRDLLSSRAAVDSGASDAELILHAYRAWDEGFLDHLAGDFAFALWDAPRQRLLCARDQLGVVPLHYAETSGSLLVATAVDVLLLHPAVSNDMDDDAVADFLLHRWPSRHQSTVFTHIRRLAPASALIWSLDATRRHRYWQLPTWEPLVRFSERQDYVDRFQSLLDDAVSDRVPGDRVAVLMSGGMDSTSVACSAGLTLARRGAPVTALRAVTAVLGGAGDDPEAHFAGLVAAAQGAVHEVVDGTMLPPVDPWALPEPWCPEPMPYEMTALSYRAGRRLAAVAPVALTGLAGDALVGSPPWYWWDWLAHGRVFRLAQAVADEIRLFHTRPRAHARSWYAHLRSGEAAPRAIPAWIAPVLSARISRGEGVAVPARARLAAEARSLCLDPTWAAVFTWAHATYSGLALSFRHPLVDLRLIRYVAALPPDPWLVDKRILREAARERLPEAVRRRPKLNAGRLVIPGLTEETKARLAAFVRAAPHTAPGIERFVDAEALADAVMAAPERGHWVVAEPVGLVHWMVHGQPPTARRDTTPAPTVLG